MRIIRATLECGGRKGHGRGRIASGSSEQFLRAAHHDATMRTVAGLGGFGRADTVIRPVHRGVLGAH